MFSKISIFFYYTIRRSNLIHLILIKILLKLLHLHWLIILILLDLFLNLNELILNLLNYI